MQSGKRVLGFRRLRRSEPPNQRYTIEKFLRAKSSYDCAHESCLSARLSLVQASCPKSTICWQSSSTAGHPLSLPSLKAGYETHGGSRHLQPSTAPKSAP